MKFVWVPLLVQLQYCMSREDAKVQEVTSEIQRGELLEAPHWDVARQSLYFVDIFGPAIYRYEYETGALYRAMVKNDSSPIGFITPVSSTTDQFIIGASRKILLIEWDGKSSEATILKILVEIDQSREGNRVNDGKVDPNGVLFFGSMGDEAKYDLADKRFGSLYSYSKETGAVVLKDNIGIGNGLTWDAKRKAFYYIDSVTRDVKQFTYDPDTSKISNETVLIDFDRTHEGIKFSADGMTIDENGNIYVATWFGSRIIVINPANKEIIREISIPTGK